MAEIDFTTLPFDEAVALAMKEFDLGEEEAAEFINLIHGKDVDDMNITEKAGKPPKGEFTKIRAAVAGKAEDPNALAAWIKNHKKMGMMKKKEITTKAGNSEGAKKGWLSRARGGASRLGAAYGKSPSGRLIKGIGRAYAKSPSGRLLSAGKKFAGSPKGKKIIKGALIGGAVVGGTALAIGAARSKRGRAALGKVGAFAKGVGRKKAAPGMANTLAEHLKPTTFAEPKGHSARTKLANAASRVAGAVTGKRSHFVTSAGGKPRKMGISTNPTHPARKLASAFSGARAAARTRLGKSAIKKATSKVSSKLGSSKFYFSKRKYVSPFGKKEASLIITKDANDKWRWTLFSTNAFEDNDKEVVSHKALLDDLEKSEVYYKENNNYGPLRWWHVVLGEDPIKDGLDIGTCDFRGMEDRIMVESGTFINEELGGALAPHAKELGGSIGFMHSTSEPDSDKVFHSIRIFERSLLPRERASNPLAQLIIQKEGGLMVKEKLEKLAQLLGGPDKAEQILGTAKEAQAAAEAEGIRTKETDVVTTKDESEVDASDEVTQEEWDGFKEAVGIALEELMEDEGEGEGGEATEEAAESKEVKEFRAAFKELGEGQNKVIEVLKSMDARVKALEGEVPNGTKFEASTSKSTITEKGKHEEPKPDPMLSFIDGFVLKH